MDSVWSIPVGIAILAWVIFNQMRTRSVSASRLRIAGVLGVIGLVQVVGALSGHPVSALVATLLLVGVVLGAGFGVARAYTMRMWTDGDGRAMQKGTPLTIVLWLVGIAAHIGLDVLARAIDPASAPVGSASVLLFVAVTLGAQGLVTLQRGRAVATPAAV